MNLLLRWAVIAIALWLTTEIYPGLDFVDSSLGVVLITALVLGLVNAIVRPIMIVLTLPLTIVTLGLFLLVVNGISLAVVIALTPLESSGFGATIVGALILTVISTLLSALVGKKES